MSVALNDLAVVALGCSLSGNYVSKEALLEAALARLASAGMTVRGRSSWWRSSSWPDATQPDYLNGVALVETALDPRAVLGRLRVIEVEFGRDRSAPNAPRTLDLDLIAYGQTRLDGPDLTLPHPRAAHRRFVMGPLAEIAPDWRHPVLGSTAAELAALADVGLDAEPFSRKVT